jgi:hypothetical protein
MYVSVHSCLHFLPHDVLILLIFLLQCYHIFLRPPLHLSLSSFCHILSASSCAELLLPAVNGQCRLDPVIHYVVCRATVTHSLPRSFSEIQKLTSLTRRLCYRAALLFETSSALPRVAVAQSVPVSVPVPVPVSVPVSVPVRN